MIKQNNYVYTVGSKLYINLTNRCSCNCDFCIRHGREGMNDTPLWLEKEPTSEQVISMLPENLLSFEEVVFCGFGEPTYRIQQVHDVGRFLKSKGAKVRINTNGQGNLIAGKDVTGLLVGAVDIVNVSLNASNAKRYQEICHSVYGEAAFDALLEFARLCREKGVTALLSVVDVIGPEEIARCRALCDKKGLTLRVRKFE